MNNNKSLQFWGLRNKARFLIKNRKLLIQANKFDNAIKFYILNLKTKGLRLILDNFEINKKIQNYYVKKFRSKRKNWAEIKIFKIIKTYYFNLINKESETRKKLLQIKKVGQA